jgi:hypothetical protein
VTSGDEKCYPEAEQLYRETLEIKGRKLGPDHRSTLVTRGNLAQTLVMENKYPEAEKLLRETIDTERHLLGPEHYDTLTSMSVLGDLRMKEKRYPEAEQLLSSRCRECRRLWTWWPTLGSGLQLKRKTRIEGRESRVTARLVTVKVRWATGVAF